MGKTNQTIGLAGEDLVRYILHRWRYDTFEPCNPSSRCDFVVNRDNKWTTIQVKTTEQGERLYLKRQKGDRLNKTVKYFMYSTDDFDFLFVVKFPKIYVIPSIEIQNNNIKIKDYEDYAYDLNDPETYNNPPQL
jgi:Holliday junction resolvase-like predicted endonuclease